MKIAPRLFAWLVASLVAGCASSGTGSTTEETAEVEAPLAAFNPCSASWQLPTYARHALVATDGSFKAFEDRLEAGGAKWVGSYALPKPWRAIVRVDHFREYTKKDPHSALWYMAAIPVSSRDAIGAIYDYASVYPVYSRVFGYCMSDGSFVPNKTGQAPPGIKSVIAEYDPRCVCYESPTAETQTWVSDSMYYGLPPAR
jgi:hypothetical protein